MKALRTSLLLFTVVSTAFAADGWTNLFNGKNLDGWIQRGGKATYQIEGNCIVGTSTVDTPNTFLCTAKDYGDFVLEYEFKIDPKLNSGVQIRSHSSATATEFTWEGKTIKIPADRVHGYQIEIDPDPAKNRWWSAGIYEEAARGWLFPGALGGDAKAFTDQGRKIFKQGDWNKVRVEAIGDHLSTTLNGVPCASIRDSLTPTGFIALQVHSIGKNTSMAGTQVRWRNLRLKEEKFEGENTLTDSEKTAGWAMLWDGKTDKGWRSFGGPDFPKSGWQIKDGILTVHPGSGAEEQSGGDLITTQKYSDFELQLDFKITPGANSGIKFFIDPEINKGAAIGPEFQILDDARHPDAKLGRDGDRTIGSLYDLKAAPTDKKVMPVGDWNHARIRSEGKRLTYWLNGVKTIDIVRGSKEWRDLVAISKFKKTPNFGELAEGHILLQDHGNTVSFQNIKLRDLSKK